MIQRQRQRQGQISVWKEHHHTSKILNSTDYTLHGIQALFALSVYDVHLN